MGKNEERYVIFNVAMPLRPISLIDRNANSEVVELPKEVAEVYVRELNKKCKKENFYYITIDDWLERTSSPQMKKVYEQMDKAYEKMINGLEFKELQKSIDEIYYNVDKNINGFMIPFEADNNEDYEKKLKEKLEKFKKEVDRPAFRKEGTLVEDIKSICNKVIQAYEAVKIDDKEKAENIIAEILEDYKKEPFAVSELDKSYAFRGIAPFESLREGWVKEDVYENMLKGDLNFFRARVIDKKEKIDEVEEISYLPYSKKHLAKDMRFSSQEKGCLYLGVTSYVCSKECRWNGKDNLYVSSFKFNEKGKKLKILNLVVLQSLLNGMIPRTNEDFHIKIHNAMLRVFPLVVATMYTVKTSDNERQNKYKEKNKAEYLLSQVLMDVLQKAGIDGIAYLSRQGKDDFQYPQMVNLAIPVNGASDDNDYGELIDYYTMTKPRLYNDFEIKKEYKRKSYINKKYPKYRSDRQENCTAKVEYLDEEVFYQDTPFSKFDDYLINQKHIKFPHGKVKTS